MIGAGAGEPTLKERPMEWRLFVRGLVTVFVVAIALSRPAFAQITTGTVAGTVKDEQGLAVPGASVTLVSEARGTRMAPVITTATGDFVITSVTADTYVLEITLEGFREVRRPGIIVSGGDRVTLGVLPLTVGSASETVTVTAETPLIQSQSGERSYSISTEAVQAIAVNGRAYNTLTNLAPGVVAGTVNGLRVNQNTLQIDGITSVDTGNNGNGVTLTRGRRAGSAGPDHQLSGGIRPLRRRADQRRDEERVPAVPRVGLRRPPQGRSQRQHLAEQLAAGCRSRRSISRTRATRLAARSGGRTAARGSSSSSTRSFSRSSPPTTRRGSACPPLLERQGDFSQTLRQRRAAVQPDSRPAFDAAVHGDRHPRVFC